MRRTLLAGALLSVVSVTAGSAAAAPPGPHGRFDRPQQGFAAPTTVLRSGEPGDVGLDPGPISAALRRIDAWTGRTPDREHPMYGGAVSLLVHDGVVVSHEAVGYELRYADGRGTELPPGQREEMHRGTIFDLASITKLFTSIAVLQQVEDGRVRLDAPVAEYVPEFAANGKQAITVRQLLTHTSGLQPTIRLWELPPQERIPAVLRVAPENSPGTTYTYSDLNMIALGVLVERITGEGLDEVVAERITEPLGMSDTGFNPPGWKLHRIAATEYQADPPRGMVRGEVHDENAWSLGGVAGHAGVFSTARDLAVLGQAILNGGAYAGERILGRDSVEKLLTNYNQEFPEHAHGLGFELDQRWYMAGLSGPRTAGHTGYTGTSLVVDPASRTVAVLLTNRVHPSREWGSNNPARRALAQGMAEALAVEPRHGSEAWFSGSPSGARTATLSTGPLGEVSGAVRVSFDAFVDTQQDPDGVDALTLESSVDGGRTWRPVRLSAHGRGAPEGPQQALAGSGHRSWWRVHGKVPAEPGAHVRLRWRYTADEMYSGRGVHLDGIRVTDASRVLLEGEREPGRFTADGWVPASR